MESFSDSSNSNKDILSWVNGLVIGLVAVHMSPAVHAPRHIQYGDITEYGADEVGVPGRLTPEVPWYDHWKDETHEDHRRQVKSGDRRKVEMAINLINILVHVLK